jgi:hypothetical protein
VQLSYAFFRLLTPPGSSITSSASPARPFGLLLRAATTISSSDQEAMAQPASILVIMITDPPPSRPWER